MKHGFFLRLAFLPNAWRNIPLSLIDREKGLQLKFFAPFALVIALCDDVALARFFDPFGRFRGFMLRAEGFPIEGRVG